MNGIGKRNSISTALTAPIRPINAIFFTFVLASSRHFRFSSWTPSEAVHWLLVHWFILNPPQKITRHIYLCPGRNYAENVFSHPTIPSVLEFLKKVSNRRPLARVTPFFSGPLNTIGRTRDLRGSWPQRLLATKIQYFFE